MHDPRTQHMIALKQIISYLKGTLTHGLHISYSLVDTLTTYTEADWGGCPDTIRSTSGYCVYLGDNLVSWSAKRQPTLSCSSAEAEYRGVANVVAESCWLRNLLLELQCPVTKATLVFCDNVNDVCQVIPFNINTSNILKWKSIFCVKRLLTVKYEFYMFCLVTK
jgi:hypothetical protein